MSVGQIRERFPHRGPLVQHEWNGSPAEIHVDIVVMRSRSSQRRGPASGKAAARLVSAVPLLPCMSEIRYSPCPWPCARSATTPTIELLLPAALVVVTVMMGCRWQLRAIAHWHCHARLVSSRLARPGPQPQPQPYKTNDWTYATRARAPSCPCRHRCARPATAMPAGCLGWMCTCAVQMAATLK